MLTRKRKSVACYTKLLSSTLTLRAPRRSITFFSVRLGYACLFRNRVRHISVTTSMAAEARVTREKKKCHPKVQSCDVIVVADARWKRSPASVPWDRGLSASSISLPICVEPLLITLLSLLTCRHTHPVEATQQTMSRIERGTQQVLTGSWQGRAGVLGRRVIAFVVSGCYVCDCVPTRKQEAGQGHDTKSFHTVEQPTPLQRRGIAQLREVICIDSAHELLRFFREDVLRML
eukprot:TRINITY_DN115650_c0_g1_i1.p1 TRINITY_DN115650_c0_g1~~TRINITY_DN115650_c0_g1_i1.p1  ORF type:complete len:233 (+),score=1.94 TRINITY_DN115650_c0_g1_i1:352-1050(+)